jgi:hypothetical protein
MLQDVAPLIGAGWAGLAWLFEATELPVAQ